MEIAHSLSKSTGQSWRSSGTSSTGRAGVCTVSDKKPQVTVEWHTGQKAVSEIGTARDGVFEPLVSADHLRMTSKQRYRMFGFWPFLLRWVRKILERRGVVSQQISHSVALTMLIFRCTAWMALHRLYEYSY